MKKIIITIFSLLTIAFLVMWFTGAHIVKRQFLSLKDSAEFDNFKIEYDQVDVSGFPFKWVVNFHNPKYTLINSNSAVEIGMDHTAIQVDFSQKVLRIILSPKINFNINSAEGESYGYNITALDPYELMVKFDKPLLFLVNQDFSEVLLHIRKLFHQNESNTLRDHEGRVIATYKNHHIEIDKRFYRGSQDIHFLAKGDYQGELPFFNFSKSNFDASGIVTTQQLRRNNYIKNFVSNVEVEKLHLSMNDDIMMRSSGNIKFFADQLPNGELKFNIQNYPELIDLVVNPNFLIKPSTLKKMILSVTLPRDEKHKLERQSDEDEDDYQERIEKLHYKMRNTEFVIHFTNKGVDIGSVALEELSHHNIEVVE